MLSTRGRTYAALDLAAGYMKERGPLYNKTCNPNGLVSLTNAENVSLFPFILSIRIVDADKDNQFLMQEKMLNFIKSKVSRIPVAFEECHLTNSLVFTCN
jgi:hypothetical protein